MLSFGHTEGQTVRQTDTGKTIRHRSFDLGAQKYGLYHCHPAAAYY